MARRTLLCPCIFIALVPGCASEAREPLLAPVPSSPIALPGGASNVALGDLNRDGHLDLVVAAEKDRDIAILLGDRKGSFVSPASFVVACGVEPGEMCLGDVNEDRILDLAIASHDSYDVLLLLGDGKGDFARSSAPPPVTGSGGKPHNHGLSLGDVDGDLHLDLVASNSEDDTVAVLLGDGKGRFVAGQSSPFAAGPAPYPLALGDIDGDGRLDIAVPDSGTGKYYREHRSLAQTVTILLGDGTGRFEPASSSPLEVIEGPFFVALGDLDGDQRLDLVTSHDDSTSITILLNDGGSRFRAAPQSPLDLGRGAWMTIIADVNGDGKRDIALATGDSVMVLLGDGRGRFAPASGSPFAAGRGVWRLALGDLDEDGKLDAITSNLESGGVSVLLGQ